MHFTKKRRRNLKRRAEEGVVEGTENTGGGRGRHREHRGRKGEAQRTQGEEGGCTENSLDDSGLG